MDAALFALLAILIVFPAAFIALYLRRRAARTARLQERRRFHDLVAYDRERRAQQWAAVPADGIPGIVLLNAVDPTADPLRGAPPSTFAEVAPGIWRSVNGARHGRNTAAPAAGADVTRITSVADGIQNNFNTQSSRINPNVGHGASAEGSGVGNASWQPSTRQQPAGTGAASATTAAHTPYGDIGHEELQMGDNPDNVGRTVNGSNGSDHSTGGVVGKPIQMDDAADAMPSKVEYGEARYLPRSRAGKTTRQFSAYSATVESESAVEPAAPSHLPFTPSDEKEGTSDTGR